MFMFLDLKLTSMIYGVFAIVIGMCFLCINYKGNQKRSTRNVLVFFVCIIIGVTVMMITLFHTKFPSDYSLETGWMINGFGVLLGIVLFIFSIRVDIKFFTQFLGFVTGFFFCNTIEIDILYSFYQSNYIEYAVSALLFAVLSNYFNVNIYNHMFSFNGAYLVVRGIVIIYDNSQIADIKMFIVQKFNAD